MMVHFSVWHGTIVLAVVFLYLFPAIKILQKAGYSRWWCIVLLVPILNMIMIWVFALASWPNLRESRDQR
jgi:predicted PurR-regulated permease PerM